jgi:hypothetical protein
MFTQETSARTRFRLSTTLVALALTGAVLVLAIQANSVRSTGLATQVPGVPAQTALSEIRDLQTSIHIPKGCTRRKFGCGQGATTSSNPDLRTSGRSSKGCWLNKFKTFSRSALGRCGQGAATAANLR